jgi:hypothetical protein
MPPSSGLKNKPSNQSVQFASCCSLLGLLLYSEDGGNMFLRNISEPLSDNMASDPERWYSLIEWFQEELI